MKSEAGRESREKGEMWESRRQWRKEYYRVTSNALLLDQIQMIYNLILGLKKLHE